MTAHLFLGIDLAWSTGWTGVAAVDEAGRLLTSGRVKSDDEIDEWVCDQPGTIAIVAVDAPLVVPNPTGQRRAERLIGQAFGGFGASAHAASQAIMGDETRAMSLARRHGWDVDPAAVGGLPTVCIEVYPHPAMIGLFGLDYRLAYKKGTGTLSARQPGFVSLMRHLESVPELELATHPRWVELSQVVASGRGLDRIEDELDAVLCAHLAWLWRYRPHALTVYGDATDGYIVAPPRPLRRPVRPAPSGGSTAAGGAATGRAESSGTVSPQRLGGRADPRSDTRTENLVAALHAIVGPPHVLSDPETTEGFGVDWTRRWQHRPLLVVRPLDAAQTAAVLRTCRRAGVAVIPQGGNTGLVGGGVPRRSGTDVVLSTSRMTLLGPVEDRNGDSRVDLQDEDLLNDVQSDVSGDGPGDVRGECHVVVGAGVTVAALARHAAAAGRIYGVDLASRDSATIGGTVATNAGGLRVCRFGDTAAQVVGLEAVLADGSVLSWMSGVAKDGAGYRMAQLLVGSEGTLAVITKVRLRLHRPPPFGIPVLAGCESLRDAQMLMGRAESAGRLQLAEVWDHASMTQLRDVSGLPDPLTRPWPWYVLLQVEPLLVDGDGHWDEDPPDLGDVDAAVDRRLLRYRERLTEAMATLPGLLKMDVALPAASLPSFVAALHAEISGHTETSQISGPTAYVFGHLAEANLHLNIATAGPETMSQVARLVVAHGGSIASEHGVGVAKAALLSETLSADRLRAMHAVKDALDPDGVLNPGAVLPVE